MFRRLRQGLTAALGCLVMIAMIAVGSIGSLSDCSGSNKESASESIPKLRDIDVANLGDQKINTALEHVWRAAGRSPETLDVLIAASRDLNAASFGDGRFVFWESAGDLPESQIEAIAAHEVAHDVLLHSRRAQDANALLAFLAEVIGVFSGSDKSKDDAIRGWLATVTLPHYSREQEFEADRNAVRLLRQMGHVHPGEDVAATLEMLLIKYGDSGGKFFDSHPATSERIARVRTLK
jgi:Zn-dependent protease with chaperone function